MKSKVIPLLTIILSPHTTDAAVVALSEGIHTQNFNAIATALPDGWDVRIGANTTSLGTTTTHTATSSTWGETTGAFKNYASAATGTAASTTEQSNATDRALGVRQTSTFGDPGASFNFNFSTIGLDVESIQIDLQMLSVQARSTPWLIQYASGSSPTSFTTLETYSDPGVFGSTTFSIPTASIGTALSNQASAWFRVVTLSPSTGSDNRDTFAIDDFQITTTAIPEPGVPTLMGIMGGFGILRRRR